MKHLILSLTTALVLMSCAEKNADANTHIAGTIKGFSSGMVYLQQMNDSTLVTIDSVQMKSDSKFKFDFNLDSPQLMYLELNRGTTKSIDNNLPLFVEPGSITVDSDLEHFYANAKITGSKNHQLFEEFQKINTKYKGELLDISKEKFDAVRFNRLQDVDSIDNKFDQKLKRKYLYAINFALTNKEYEVAPYVALAELSDANIKYLDSISKSVSPKVAESRYGKLLTELIKARKSE